MEDLDYIAAVAELHKSNFDAAVVEQGMVKIAETKHLHGFNYFPAILAMIGFNIDDVRSEELDESFASPHIDHGNPAIRLETAANHYRLYLDEYQSLAAEMAKADGIEIII